jgi:hypothetical protein
MRIRTSLGIRQSKWPISLRIIAIAPLNTKDLLDSTSAVHDLLILTLSLGWRFLCLCLSLSLSSEMHTTSGQILVAHFCQVPVFTIRVAGAGQSAL